MPINASGPERAAMGFTLIEMLVVLALIALVAALALPRFAIPPATGGSQRATEIVHMLANARKAAIRAGQMTALEASSLAAGARLAPAIGYDPHILFYPDGSSNGGTLTLATGQRIHIRFSDGAVTRAHD